MDLPSPTYFQLPDIEKSQIPDGENIYDHRLSSAVAKADPNSDFILIDCPGSHTRLSQVAHSLADTLITPLNDSFVDFDLLAHVSSDGEKIEAIRLFRNGVARPSIACPSWPETHRLDRGAQPRWGATNGQ